MRKLVFAALAAHVGTFGWMGEVAAQGADDCTPTVYPPHSVVHGLTIGEWTAKWWQWVASVPSGENPIKDDPTGEFAGNGQSGPVFFLGGAFSPGAYTRTCTVPAGKSIFFPVANGASWNSPGETRTQEELIEAASRGPDLIKCIECSIDGKEVPDLLSYRQPYCCFRLTLPEDHIFDPAEPPGDREPCASDGYWLMLPPLCEGPHTIRFEVFFGDCDPDAALFWLDVTYEITVGCTPTVYPPHSMVHDSTLGEWGGKWWQWVASVPSGENPIKDDPTGEFAGNGQSGPVFFLGGAFASGAYTRTCRVPAGKDIFFPVGNSAGYNSPGETRTQEELIKAASGSIDRIACMECSIDGKAVPDLLSHREAYCCYTITLPENHVFGTDPPGNYEPAVSDGYWLMIPPLCEGDHKIRFKVFIGDCDPDASLFWLDVTYDITVAPESGFRRGDSNGDGTMNLTDGVFTLEYLFRSGSAPPCLDATDANDDGGINVSDAVYSLNYLFRGGDAPPAPGPETCGGDPSVDDFAECRSSC